LVTDIQVPLPGAPGDYPGRGLGWWRRVHPHWSPNAGRQP